MKHAIISVSDKRGLADFACKLVSAGYRIYSTGNTYEHIRKAEIEVRHIEDLTRFPELMEGRVKTLHPRVHAGILGKRDDKTHQEEALLHALTWIDLVVVNLYPFKETVLKGDADGETIIEQIDIGGPAMIRSAAKNHRYVGVVVDPGDYDVVSRELQEKGILSHQTKRMLAAKAFRLTAQYDAHIASYFTEEAFPKRLTLTYDLKDVLRYGENPHQKAALYENGLSMNGAVSQAKIRHGKKLSYNNIRDADAACRMLRSFVRPTAVAVKHMNPCGIASADRIEDAFDKAYRADPVSIFGGIVALNDIVDVKLATKLASLFLEVVIAKAYTKDSFGLLSRKKNIRLLEWTGSERNDTHEIHSIDGGMLIQTQDMTAYESHDVLTSRKPDDNDMVQLHFGYEVVRHVKSNAIVVVKDDMTIGIGAGQMNRIGAAKLALEQAGSEAKDAYLASDAFFPMKDTVELAATYGIKAIIQPGGSIRDQESVDACDHHGMIMVMTGQRRFRH